MKRFDSGGDLTVPTCRDRVGTRIPELKSANRRFAPSMLNGEVDDPIGRGRRSRAQIAGHGDGEFRLRRSSQSTRSHGGGDFGGDDTRLLKEVSIDAQPVGLRRELVDDC